MKSLIILALISNLSSALDIDTFNKHKPLNHEFYKVWKDIKALNLSKSEEIQFTKDLNTLLSSHLDQGSVLEELDFGIVEITNCKAKKDANNLYANSINFRDTCVAETSMYCNL